MPVVSSFWISATILGYVVATYCFNCNCLMTNVLSFLSNTFCLKVICLSSLVRCFHIFALYFIYNFVFLLWIFSLPDCLMNLDSYCCYNKQAQSEWLKQCKFIPLLFLRSEFLQIRCSQGCIPPRVTKRESIPILL